MRLLVLSRFELAPQALFQFFHFHNMVEDADSQRALGGDWRSGKNQFFDNVEARVAGQVVNADQVEPLKVDT